LNPRTWVPKASTLTSRPPKPLDTNIRSWKYLYNWSEMLT
jgi:hypothetical protein